MSIIVENEELDTLTINGKQYEILFTAKWEEANRSYIAYTDYSTDSQDNVRVYVSAYEDKDGDFRLFEIKTEEEYEIVQNIMNQISMEMEDEKDI